MPDSLRPKFIIDSNVWIDAVVSDDRDYKNICNQAIDRAKNNGIIIDNKVTFQDLVNAVHKKLNKNELKRPVADKLFKKYKAIIVRTHEIMTFKKYGEKFNEQLSKCQDKDDHSFLALAHEQGAAHIMTNDKHLLNMGEYMGTKILTPKDFLKELLLLQQNQKPDTITKTVSDSPNNGLTAKKETPAPALSEYQQAQALARELMPNSLRPVNAQANTTYSHQVIGVTEGGNYAITRISEKQPMIHKLAPSQDPPKIGERTMMKTDANGLSTVQSRDNEQSQTRGPKR